MGAFVLSQIPDPHIPSSVTAYELSLIRMDNHIIDRTAVRIIPLHRCSPGIPNLYSAIFGAGDHPFPFAMESHAGDIARVPLESEKRCGVRGADVVELDIVVAGRGEEPLVRGYAEAVHLGVGVLDCAGADAGEGFPEADCVVVASWAGDVSFLRETVGWVCGELSATHQYIISQTLPQQSEDGWQQVKSQGSCERE